MTAFRRLMAWTLLGGASLALTLSAQAQPPLTPPAHTGTGTRAYASAPPPAAAATPAGYHTAIPPGQVATGSTSPPDNLAAEDPAPPSRKHTPIPLRPRSNDKAEASADPAAPAAAAETGALDSLVTVGSSLAIVLGLFFVVAWAFRKQGARNAGTLPGEVLEVLGRSVLPDRKQLQLLRLGNKLLLVCNSPAGMETLTEIVDRDEVQRLAGLCQQSSPRSASANFRQVLDELGSQPHDRGFLGDAKSEPSGSWFRTALAKGQHA